MRQISRLQRAFLSVAGLSFTAVIVVALAIFHSTPVVSSNNAVPTLFVLSSISTTAVPTMQSPVVASVSQTVVKAPLVAFAPTNTLQPVFVIPNETMTPAQALVIAETNNVVPTSAPLWTSSNGQTDIVPTVPQGGAVPNQIVVRFKSNATDAQKQVYIASIGGTVDQKIDHLDTVVVNVPDSAKVAAADNSIVKASEPDFYLSALTDVAASNDPAMINQWALSAIQAPSAWSQLSANAPGVVVAVIDSGICASHPDLADHVVAGWDFVENDAAPQDELGHGCSVSGVIAADIDNNVGIAGVAPNARIMPLRVLNAQGVGRYSDVASAIIYAADHGAQIVNVSLGGTYASSTLKDAIDYAAGKGLTIVAASGNTGTAGVLYPAAYSSVVAVGSVDQNLQRSSFSTYGPEVDLMAPGRNILTTTLNGDYGYVSGTSFAAPQVAGVAAIDRALGIKLPSGGKLVYAGTPAVQPEPTAEVTVDFGATAEATDMADVPLDPKFADLLAKVQANGHVRLIVGVNAGFSAASADSSEQRTAIAQSQNDVISALSAYDVSITAQYEVIPYIALKADEAALRYLASSPEVTSIQEDKPVPPIAITNTSLTGADSSWNMGYTGAGQAVAVLDTGVETGHSYLGGRVVAERCHSTSDSAYGVVSLCPNGSSAQSGSGAANPSKCSSIEVCSHGTHVSGIVAGKNGTQSGMAPGANIIAVQIFSRFNNSLDCGGAAPCIMSYESDQISGLQDVYNLRSTYSIAAINMSLGGGKYTSYCDSVEVSMKSMIDSLRAAGIATVIAAGNNGYSNAMSAPGCISSAISVGATDLNDTIASWSNRTSFLSLYAPGVGINSSVIGGGYASWSGTSMATPHVAGALAVLRSYAPGATVSELLTALKNTGAPVTDSTIKRIQIDAALVALGAQAPAVASPTPTPSDVIFADSFETGALAAWKSAATDNGNLSVSGTAAIVGGNGLQALINDKNALYVTDETPAAEKSYRARFYLDPNTIKMSSGDEFYVFYGYTGSSTQVVRVEMQYTSGKYQLRAAIRNDGSTWKTTSWFTITDAPHAAELYWLAATKAGANNGSVTLWIDGAQKGSVTKIDNDTRKIDMVRLGAIEGIDSNTKGTIFFDAFESHRTTYIGLATGAKLASLSAEEPVVPFTPEPTVTEMAATEIAPTVTEAAPTATEVVPVTDIAPTPTEFMPTQVPATEVAPTQPSASEVAPTAVPPTEVSPTVVPPTQVPPTVVPPTEVPPTEAPATEAPVIQTQEPEKQSLQSDDSTQSNDAPQPDGAPNDGG